MRENHVGDSTELLKKAAFIDELNNRLLLLPADQVDKETLAVINYLKARVTEINKAPN
jgi:hypothetical protein